MKKVQEYLQIVNSDIKPTQAEEEKMRVALYKLIQQQRNKILKIIPLADIASLVIDKSYEHALIGIRRGKMVKTNTPINFNSTAYIDTIVRNNAYILSKRKSVKSRNKTIPFENIEYNRAQDPETIIHPFEVLSFIKISNKKLVTKTDPTIGINDLSILFLSQNGYRLKEIAKFANIADSGARANKSRAKKGILEQGDKNLNSFLPWATNPLVCMQILIDKFPENVPPWWENILHETKQSKEDNPYLKAKDPERK